MKVGSYVIDGDDDDPDLAVVLDRPGVSIEEWTVSPSEGDERTVADDNPDYDPEEPTVVVAFVDSGLDTHWPEWTDADPGELYDGAQTHDVKRYAFPESRLRTVSEERAALMRVDAAIDLEALRERLEGAGWDIEVDSGGGLVGEKMGERYRIAPDGEVEGDGQIRKPLENIVDEYTD